LRIVSGVRSLYLKQNIKQNYFTNNLASCTVTAMQQPSGFLEDADVRPGESRNKAREEISEVLSEI
jgi:hypothetical protein